MEVVDNMTYLVETNIVNCPAFHYLNSREGIFYILNISMQVLTLNIFNVITNTCSPATKFLLKGKNTVIKVDLFTITEDVLMVTTTDVDNNIGTFSVRRIGDVFTVNS